MKTLLKSVVTVITLSSSIAGSTAFADSIHGALKQTGSNFVSGGSSVVRKPGNSAWTIQDYVDNARTEKKDESSSSVASIRSTNGIVNAL